MEFIPAILTVALVHLLAVISPGPDFIMVARNTLMYSKRTGIYTAIGLGLGILLHVTYSLIGVGLLIAQSIVLFTIIKYIGAAYLIYIGFKSLTSKASSINVNQEHRVQDITPLKAIQIGFVTNATNPKATLFFLSLFTLVINPNTPNVVKLIMGAEMSLVTALWFMLVAHLISLDLIKSRLGKIQHKAERFIGLVLIGLGIKVALSTSK